jgi:hypothetical protein
VAWFEGDGPLACELDDGSDRGTVVGRGTVSKPLAAHLGLKCK